MAKSNKLPPPFPGTENLVTITEFVRLHNILSHKWVYQYIELGLIVPAYIGVNRIKYIDKEKYKDITVRYLRNEEVTEIRKQNKIK